MGTDVKITTKLNLATSTLHRLRLELIIWNLLSTKGSTAVTSLAPAGAAQWRGWMVHLKRAVMEMGKIPRRWVRKGTCSGFRKRSLSS